MQTKALDYAPSEAQIAAHFNGYKSQCDRCGRRTWYETEQQCHVDYPKRKTCKSCGHSEEVEPMKMERCPGTLRIIDYSALDYRFLDYYQSGQRLELVYQDGSRERGYIGKSTGWRPIWLLISRRDQDGGAALPCGLVREIIPLKTRRT